MAAEQTPKKSWGPFILGFLFSLIGDDSGRSISKKIPQQPRPNTGCPLGSDY